jgi:hypothetical protein
MEVNIKYAGGILAVILILIFGSYLYGGSTGKQKPLSPIVIAKLRHTMETVDQLLNTAKQDSDIITALNHITSAVAKAEVVDAIMSDSEARRYLNINLPAKITVLRKYRLKVLEGVSLATLST